MATDKAPPPAPGDSNVERWTAQCNAAIIADVI
jgi:hypothetical protein